MATALLFLWPTSPNEMVPRRAVHGPRPSEIFQAKFEPARIVVHNVHSLQISSCAETKIFLSCLLVVSSNTMNMGWVAICVCVFVSRMGKKWAGKIGLNLGLIYQFVCVFECGNGPARKGWPVTCFFFLKKTKILVKQQL